MLNKKFKNKITGSGFITAVLFASLSTIAIAQEDKQSQDETEPEQQSVENSDLPDNQQSQEASKPNTSGEVFIPSEELSEDSSAPFPVDI